MPELLPMRNRTKQYPHVSSILQALYYRLGIYVERDHWPVNKMRLGNALEHARILQYQAEYPGRYTQPGELIYDGVALTPDLFNLDARRPTEIKLSWYSSATDIDSQKLLPFRWQLKSYVYAMSKLGMSDGSSGELEIAFPRGDYKSDDCGYGHWIEYYSEDELESHWQMILNHKHLVEIGR